MSTTTITETGCFLDNHRGHYITCDAILLAVGHGFIIGPFEQFALGLYTEFYDNAEYPNESLIELCDEAVNWLNSGQDKCPDCTDGFLPTADFWTDKAGRMRCKTCSGHGQGPRIEGQNFPPIVPEGYYWAFNDGDFGLYKEEELD
jgi:hypothetical protein